MLNLLNIYTFSIDRMYNMLYIYMYTNIRRYTVQKSNKKDLEVVFFESESGNQPARDFIKSLTKEEKRIIGADVRIVQNSFPIGLPLVRKLRPKLWEIRSDLKDGINRVFFTFINEKIILLHGIVKKTQKTPPKEINVATERIKEYKRLQK